MTSEPLNQYTEICRDSIKSSSAKLSKTFENLLLEILLLYMMIRRKINFTQMERYGTYCEQTFRTNFNRSRAKCIGWDTSCKLACSRQTCSVPILQQHTVVTLCKKDITPCCLPSSCNTDVSSAPQPVVLPLFCSSSACCFLKMNNSRNVS